MRRRISLFAALLTALAVLVSSFLITLAAYQDFFNTIKREVRAQAAYLSAGIALGGEDYLAKLERRDEHRLTLIAPDGTVRFDSMGDPDAMDNHLSRSEVQEALAGGTGESTRYSSTLRENTYYYALKLADGSILRIASDMDSVLASYNRLFWLVLLIALSIILLSAVIATAVTKRIVRPINALDLDHPESNAVYDELLPLLGRIKEQRGEIDRQMEELDQRRAQFSAITENMNEGFLILGREGRVLSFNKSALRLLDAEVRDSVNTHVLALNRSEAFRDAAEAALRGEARERIVTIAGRQCQVFASPVRSEKSLEGAVLMLMDVTERQEREQLRREFTANVSHELKTPLTAISGYAEIMLGGMAKEEDVPEFLQSIYNETQRLIALIRDLMLLSRLEESGPPVRERVELVALAGESVNRLAAKAAERGVSVSVTGEPVYVLGIPSVLAEISYNLLENAIKYNQPGGSATVFVKTEGKQAVFAVTDTGIGIPKAERGRIFERFYRVDKSRNEAIEGTGLGLAIVKHGAQLHGATVGLKSGPGGSTFTLRFPLSE